MRILFYNWANFNEKNTGGGVSVYQKNIIDAFSQYTNDTCIFLFSGEVYSPFTTRPYIKKTLKQHKNCPIYCLVNSTVVSPALPNFYNIQSYLDIENETILDLLTNFINKLGGVDVLHLNNLEGLPLNILKLKERFPSMKIVFSLHNYMPFCPTVNLYDFEKHQICNDFQCGKRCSNCQEINVDYKIFKEKLKNYERMLHPILGKFKFCSKYFHNKRATNVLGYKNVLTASLFQEYRKKNIEYLNTYTDVILSVSKRIKEIATSYGIDSEKNYVSYIGTKAADISLEHQHTIYKKNKLNICYLGYVREDKGFFFLLKALKSYPNEYAQNISIKFIAKGINSPEIQDDINILKSMYANIELIDGYSHDNLKPLLSDIHLGIVPVVWEDNLPQIAIEMVSMGIPILASSSGGPSELSSSPFFKFKCASVIDFNEKLLHLQKNPQLFSDFWKKKMKLVSLKEHIYDLKKFYSNLND